MIKKKIVSYVLVLSLFVSVFTITGSPAAAKASDDASKDFANVVLFAHLAGPDAKEDAAFFANKSNRDALIKMYDGPHGRSFKNYMNTISYGKFNVKNIFPQDDGTKITSYPLSVSKEDAANGDVDYTVIKELLTNLPDVQNKVIDYDSDGTVDNLTVILCGDGNRNSGSTPTLYPHRFTYNYPDTWSGKKIYNYNILNTDRLMDERSGLIAHEFLHSIGYPDLYKHNGSGDPVGTWDIMAISSTFVNYPLAYLRAHFSGWLDIDTITTNKTLTLHTQDNAEGNQAYILKSPLNEYEFFVVEFRKRFSTDTSDQNTLDFKIGGDGIIVYRIDTTVTNLSNASTQDGVYVFRPQPGQSGYIEGNERLNAAQAFLSAESGRTGIGSADLSKTLTDGALTYSNGTNSGIVIKNVSSGNGSSITMDVEIPQASMFDTWTDTNFSDTVSDEGGKYISMTARDNIQYFMTYKNGKYALSTYDGTKWTAQGNGFSDANAQPEKKLIFHGDDLYFGYVTISNDRLNFVLKKYDFTSKAWTDVASITNRDSFGMESINGELYIAAANGTVGSSLYKLKGTALEDQGQYFDGWCGQPKICGINGQVYVSIRIASTANTIDLYKYNDNENYTKVSNDSIAADSYDMTALQNKIYFALGGGNANLKIATFDGSTWASGKSSNIISLEPKLVASQGNMYLLTTPQPGTSGNTRVYGYDRDTDTFTQEGIDIDAPSSDLTLASSENHLYVGYVQNLNEYNFKIKVKAKQTVNSLLSLSITPPAKTVYEQGAAVDTSGLKVTANYVKGTKLLTSDDYALSGFDTNTTGQRLATVTYEGKSNTFIYEVKVAAGEAGGNTTPTQPPIVEPKPTAEELAKQAAAGLTAPKSTLTNLCGYDDVKFSWTPSRGASGYRVYYKRSSWKSWSYLGSTIGTSVKKMNLADGAKYYFRVYPYITANGKKYTAPVYKTGLSIYTLKKISKPSLSKSSHRYVKVRWSNIPGESGYQIARSKYKSKQFKVVKVCSYKYSTTTIKTTRHQKYYYKIRAYKTVNGMKIYAPWSSVQSYILR